MVDRFVSAKFPDEKNDPILFDTVSKCMVHGPCGERDPGAACMSKGKCTKGYPNKYTDTTTLDEGGYPSYRRRRDGIEVTVRNNKKAYNIDVVPYNPHLSRMFNFHINVEICAGIRAVKYINKYIHKGGDRATMVLGEHDEILQYIDARYIGPPEAVWRLLEYHLHEEYPVVQRLAIHLQNKRRVFYNARQSMTSVIQTTQEHKTTLMGYFEYYAKILLPRPIFIKSSRNTLYGVKRLKSGKLDNKDLQLEECILLALTLESCTTYVCYS
ncbi:uncharacterized protein LOC113352799 [Papaver somniferum]|uniref:uncharacterized protein LOC113352799 n=1 Tax=Papaver somniferum TaxID=3469 RepID=UPI000E6F6856|nr:uncharacterized protein LOC113352799 [Papaver somniferum]